MVAKQGVIRAKEAIEKALEEFIHHRASDKVYVFESEWGYLEALLGCAAFEGMSVAQRQDSVWDFLRKSVDAEDLTYLSSVQTMDHREYDASVREV